MSTQIDEGIKLVDELRMADAVRHFEALLSQPAEQMEAHLWVAKLRIASGELEEAAAHLEAVLHQNPHRAEAPALKGVLALRSGNPSEAIRLFVEANRLDGSLLIVHVNLAAGYRLLNLLPEALRAAREAVERFPDNAQARLELARTLWQMDSKQEALQTAIEVLDIDNGFLPVYVDVANWLMAENQLDAAIVTLEQGLALLPQNSDLRALLARAYLKAGSAQEAVTAARQLVSQRGWAQDRELLAECTAAAGERPKETAPRAGAKLRPKATQNR